MLKQKLWVSARSWASADDLLHLQLQVLDCDCTQYLSQKFKENGWHFPSGRMLSPVFHLWVSWMLLFPLSVSQKICAQILVVTTMHFPAKESGSFISSAWGVKAVVTEQLWSFQSFSLDCACEVAVPCSCSVLRIYHSHQQCVPVLTWWHNSLPLLTFSCGNEFACDGAFSSNLNVVL